MPRRAAAATAYRAGAARLHADKKQALSATHKSLWSGTRGNEGFHACLRRRGVVVVPLPQADLSKHLTADERMRLMRQVARSLQTQRAEELFTKEQRRRLAPALAALRKRKIKVGGPFFQGADEDGDTHVGDSLRVSRFTHVSCGSGIRKVRAIEEMVREVFAREFPALRNTSEDNSLLLALAGATHQPAHVDQPIDDKLLRLAREAPHDLPVSCIISLQDPTHIDVWPESANASVRFFGNGPYPDPAQRVPMERIQVPAYHMVIFYTTTVHAGSAYEEDNLRLHMYFDNLDAPRDSDRTFLVANFPHKKRASAYFARQ